MIYTYNQRSWTDSSVALPHFQCDQAAGLHQQRWRAVHLLSSPGLLSTDPTMVMTNNSYVSVFSVLSVLKSGVGWELALTMQIYTLIAYYSPTGLKPIYSLGCSATGNFFPKQFYHFGSDCNLFFILLFFWS